MVDTNASSGPVVSPSARVRDALAATPPSYLASCLAQRVNGPDAAGSVFTDYRDPQALLAALQGATWEPYTHPDIMSGCDAFRAPLNGRLGIVRLDVLDRSAAVVLADPKHTGAVEATVPGILGDGVDFAVAILGPDAGREVCYTFHPGAPVSPSQVRAPDMHGRMVTVAEALALGLVWAKIVR